MANELQIIQNEIESIQEEFSTVLTDRAISFAKEAEFAMQAIKSTDFMTNAAYNNPQALRNAIMNIAAIGITLNPAQKMAYLIPRKVGDKIIVCLDISYMGLVQLALQSDSLRLVKAEVICKGEQFIISGVDKEPLHEYDPFAERGEKDIVGAYCVAKTVHGDFITEVMSRHEIDKIMNSSESMQTDKGRKYSPWTRYYAEMAKKTVIKRASKLWPKGEKSDRLAKAIDMLNNESGEGDRNIKHVTLDIEPTLAQIATCTNMDALKAIWESVKNLLPAKTEERHSVMESIKSKKLELSPIVDAEPVETVQ